MQPGLSLPAGTTADEIAEQLKISKNSVKRLPRERDIRRTTPRRVATTEAVAYPWGTLGHVVDVGGGNASLLIAILRAHDDLRGTVIDLPGPVARAEQAIVSAGLATGRHPGRQLLRCPSRRSGRLRALGCPPRLG